MSSYVLDNAHDAAATRLAILEELYDPLTQANLDGCGIGPNRDVWEVGAGAGSIAWWAADKRGARVMATDVDLRHLSAAAHLGAHAILRHDVAADEPVGYFDLIHARLVLSHLPAWDRVLIELCGALRPGGWLAVEELDPMLPYVPTPQTPGDALANRVGAAFTRALASRGGQPILGRALHGLLLDGCGLQQVQATGTILTGTGGGRIAQLMTVNTTQTADLLADEGITRDDLDAYHALLRDGRQRITMPVFWAARGQVPA